MNKPAAIEIHRLSADDLAIMDATLTLYSGVFAEPKTYDAARPDAAYTRRLLTDDGFVALAALYDKLGTREEVLHFDIPPRPRAPRG